MNLRKFAPEFKNQVIMDLVSLYEIFRSHPQVTTDSRHCPEGSLFFALKGASFDGNAFAKSALEQGCAYAVIDNPAYADAADGRLILVDDVLSSSWRTITAVSWVHASSALQARTARPRPRN